MEFLHLMVAVLAHKVQYIEIEVLLYGKSTTEAFDILLQFGNFLIGHAKYINLPSNTVGRSHKDDNHVSERWSIAEHVSIAIKRGNQCMSRHLCIFHYQLDDDIQSRLIWYRQFWTTTLKAFGGITCESSLILFIISAIQNL